MVNLKETKLTVSEEKYVQINGGKSYGIGNSMYGGGLSEAVQQTAQMFKDYAAIRAAKKKKK